MKNNFPFCIYCGETDRTKLTKGHVFAQVIGGRVWVTNCVKCNSMWGRQVESQIKKTPFFAVGIAKLGLQNIQTAFRDISISDWDTGIPLHIVKGNLEGKPSVDRDRSISGNSEFVIEYMINKTKRDRPHWVEYLRSQFDERKQIINIAGDKFSVQRTKPNKKLKLQGRLFPYELLAKLTYDLMRGFTFPNSKSMKQFHRSTFEFFASGKKNHRVVIRKEFFNRISTAHMDVLNGKLSLEDIKYSRFHRVDLRVASISRVVYLKINFFEAVSFIIAISELDGANVTPVELLNQRLLFPIDIFDIIPEKLLQEHEWLRKEEDAAATRSWKNYLSYTKEN